MLGIFKRENTTTAGEASRDGASDPIATEPTENDTAGDMENRIAALSEAEAGISRDIENTKWAALEEQQARAAALRAELEQTQSRLEQHREEIEAREAAAADVALRAGANDPGANDPGANDPGANDPAGDMENRIAALSEAQAGVSRDIENTKWATLEEQQARAVVLRAELEQTQSRLEQHREEIEAREAAAADVALRADNLKLLAPIAKEQGAHLETMRESLADADTAARELQDAVLKIIDAAVWHTQRGYRFNQIRLETPGDRAALWNELQEAGEVSPSDLAAARAEIASGFDSKTFRGAGALSEAAKDVSPLAWKLIETLLLDWGAQKAIKAATRPHDQAAAAWFPPDKTQSAPRRVVMQQ
jgi:uncharacterized membrane-anchored protein YhcB (DUF1043 family)